MVNLFEVFSYGIVIVWFPLMLNLIFNLFMKRTRNGRFKLRWGKIKGHENLNPFLGTGKSLIILIIFELVAIALNLIFFEEFVSLVSLIKLNTIPLFVSSFCFFVFWIAKNNIGAKWKNKFVWIPFFLFCFIFIVWGIVLIIKYI
jgi:hypothetical protein